MSEPFYCCVMFPYPSGAGLHLGHYYNYAIIDSYCRWLKLRGQEVFQPFGYDAFGLPAENYARQIGGEPSDVTWDNINHFRNQMNKMNTNYNEKVVTCLPSYVKWTQWLFQMLQQHKLAYKADGDVNFCPSCDTVLANEQVKDNHCDRCGTEVVMKNLNQWYFKITAYRDRLIQNLDHIDYPESTKKQQRAWLKNQKDWCVSRQRKWGCPIPVDGETDTLDTFVDSSFYFLRYLDPCNRSQLFSPEKYKQVDLYVGGNEHACMHLIYARFIHMFLFDIGIVPVEEPFKKVIHQGVITKDGHKMGKCFGIDTPILMFDGTVKAIQNIEVGDKVMGVDSKPKTVLNLVSGREALYCVSSNDGSQYVVNKSHILALKMPGNRYGRYKVGNHFEISVEDYLKQSNKFHNCMKGFRTAVNYCEQNIRINPYILGIWLGDGNSADQGITNCDLEILNSINAEALIRNLTIKEYKKRQGKASTYHMVKKDQKQNSFCQDLRYYDLFYNKHIPLVYLTNSKSNRLELLAGLIDTDGSVTKHGYYEFVNKNKVLAYNVQKLSRSLGFSASISTVRKKSQNGTIGLYYRVYISGDCATIPVRISYKKTNRMATKNPLVYGISIKEIGIGNYFGFTIGEDELFLLGNDFTVVHNSKGNAVNPDDYNPDELRMYLMFLGHYFDGGEWSDDKIVGITKFLKRMNIWLANATFSFNGDGKSGEILELKNFEEKIDGYVKAFKFNKVISEFMTFYNNNKDKTLFITSADRIAQLLKVFAPGFKIKRI